MLQRILSCLVWWGLTFLPLQVLAATNTPDVTDNVNAVNLEAPLRLTDLISGDSITDAQLNQAELTRDVFAQPLIRLSLTETTGISSLNLRTSVKTGQGKTLHLTYQSNLADSSRDRGAWILINWQAPDGRQLQRDYIALEPSHTWKDFQAKLAAPTNASQLELQIRVQERIGVMTIKSIQLTDADITTDIDTGNNEQIQSDIPSTVTAGMTRTHVFQLDNQPGKSPTLKLNSISANDQTDVSLQSEVISASYVPASGPYPLGFVLPAEIMSAPDNHYLIEFSYRFNQPPENRPAGLMQIGRNMHGLMPNSLALNFWNPHMLFARLTGVRTDGGAQVIYYDFSPDIGKNHYTAIWLSDREIRHFHNGVELGQAQSKSAFSWPTDRTLWLGGEDLGLSLFTGEILSFRLAIYKPQFQMTAPASEFYWYGKKDRNFNIDLRGTPPATAPQANIISVNGEDQVIPLATDQGEQQLSLTIPTDLPYGYGTIQLNWGDVVFTHDYVAMSVPVKRGLAENSPFGACQGLPLRPHEYDDTWTINFMQFLADAGYSHFRFWLNWNKVQDEKQQFDFTALDKMVDAAELHGIQLYPIFSGGSYDYQIAVKSPYHLNEGAAPPLPGWTNFLQTVASRYKDRITTYQIWNEADARNCFYPFDPKVYTELLQQSYQTLKAVNADISVALGGFCAAYMEGFRNKTTHLPDDSAWGLAEFYLTNPQPFYDIVDLHFYSSAYPKQSWDQHFLKIPALREFLTENKDGDKPLWNSETGFVFGTPGRSAGWGVANVVSRLEHAWEVVKFNVQSLAVGVERSFLYIPLGEDSGLANSDFSPNPAFAAHVFMVSQLADAEFAQEYQLNRNLRLYRFQRSDGKSLYIGWTLSGRELISLTSDSIQSYDFWGNILPDDQTCFQFTTQPSYFITDTPITSQTLATLSVPDLVFQDTPIIIKLLLRNPTEISTQVEIFYNNVNGTNAKINLELPANAVQQQEIELPAIATTLEVGLRFRGGINTETVLTTEMNPRPVLDLSAGKISEIRIDQATQLYIGKEFRDDQDRLVKTQQWRDATDLSATVRLWQENDKVRFIVDVVDDVIVSSPDNKHLYNYDAVEFFLDPSLTNRSADSSGLAQTVVSVTGQVEHYGQVRFADFVVASSLTPQGYRLDGSFAIPVNTDLFGFNISISDSDVTGNTRKSALTYYGQGENHANSDGYAIIKVR